MTELPRRHFLKTAAGAAGFLLAARNLAWAQDAAPASDPSSPSPDRPPIKVGLIGCGGRGLGAMKDALDACPEAVAWAMGDVFDERVMFGCNLIKEQFGDRMQATDGRKFTGLDAYKGVIGTGIDVVLLCSPPAFRPNHFAAAVEANKHIYAEKPIAVDVPGVMSVLETAKLAATKPLVILDGLCWHYDQANVEAHEVLHTNKLGKILSFDGIYYTTPPKSPLALNSRPAHESDVVWELRNWTAWNWLSGGPMVEQIIHTIDSMLWSMNGALPIAAMGVGGRTQRRDDGDVWDNYNVIYEFENDVSARISSRQWVGCHGQIEDRTVCEKGTLITPYRPRIQAATRWRYRGEKGNMYADTLVAFFKHLQAKEWKQTIERVAITTLVAILGRDAAQTGQRITLDQIKQSTTRLVPDELTLDSALPPPRIPMPGRQG